MSNGYGFRCHLCGAELDGPTNRDYFSCPNEQCRLFTCKIEKKTGRVYDVKLTGVYPLGGRFAGDPLRHQPGEVAYYRNRE